MTPLTHSEIYGNWATLLVPVNEDNSINYTLLGEEIDILIGMRVNGIYSNGTAGEFYNQTETEFRHINSLLADKCNAAQMPFQVGCNHMSPQLSLERLRFALTLAVPGHHLATGISLGAHGAYSNVACLHPLAAQRWYDNMLTDMPRALELEQRIQLFMSRDIVPYISEQGFSNQAVDKLLAAIGGWANIGTRLRWPYQSIDPQEITQLRAVCREILPEFYMDIKD